MIGLVWGFSLLLPGSEPDASATASGTHSDQWLEAARQAELERLAAMPPSSAAELAELECGGTEQEAHVQCLYNYITSQDLELQDLYDELDTYDEDRFYFREPPDR